MCIDCTRQSNEVVVHVSADADDATSVETAKRDAKVAGYLADKQIVKTIYVPAKLISFVVK